MVIQDERSKVDNKRFLKRVQQYQQGQLGRDPEKIYYLEWHLADGSSQVDFLICSTYDHLSSKNNIFKWKKEGNPTSPLYNDKPQTLEHVLSSCKSALGNGRYTWRHNRVLDELVRFIKNYMKSEATISTQKFVEEYLLTTIKHQAISGQNLLG